MCKWLCILIIFLFIALPSFAQNQRQLEVKTGTGATNNSCNIEGYAKAGIQFAFTGTATVKIEVRQCTTCAFLFLKDDAGADVTVTVNEIIGIGGYSFSDMRFNVTSFTSGTITGTCNYWRYSR